MSDTIGFNAGWLNERYRFDTAARNHAIEQKCMLSFKEKDTIRIADIGAGTGANVIYFLDRFPMDQAWTLIEHDSVLIDAAKTRFINFAKEHKYTIQLTDEGLIIATNTNRITIDFAPISILEINTWPLIQEMNLITAGAVFDLFSEAQFQQFAEVILKNKIAFLATLNYQGMSFLPQDEADDFYINQYEAHMIRPQDFGVRMAMHSTNLMYQYFKEKEVVVDKGPSNWDIQKTDSKMLHFLIDYMEGAIKEMKLTKEELTKFDAWLRQKRTMISDQKLSMKVLHQDLFSNG